MDERDFGAKIKARREEVGISQQDIANALNLDQGKISQIERGLRRVEVIHELPTIAKLLKVPVSWFYSEHGLLEEKPPFYVWLGQYFSDTELSNVDLERMEQYFESLLLCYAKTHFNQAKQQQSGKAKTNVYRDRPRKVQIVDI